ncbi:MAG: UvrD-helicase domain-containing protein [Hyphomicrobiales bacterium]
MSDSSANERHSQCDAARKAATNAILDSESNKIVVVAGPGTGKTTLFGVLLKARGGRSLTLSFINALVDDLAISLCGLSDVKTLHGYSVGLLKQVKEEAEIFPKLPRVIREDGQILLGEDVDFNALFQDLDAPAEMLRFYKARKDCYGPYYGFADVIYALVMYFEAHPEKIPAYDQIVVDEFQDFNKTEVRLVEQLATKSPILLAGDDDQALYASLKRASPDHIREKFTDKTQGYEPHTLPFCSRSVEVIVGAVNDLVQHAQKHGLSLNRIDKPYLYFSDKMKDEESSLNSMIDYAQAFDGQLAWFIQQQLKAVISRERKKFEVLVIVPPQVKKHALPKLADALRKKGFRKIIFVDKSDTKEPTFCDGLQLLMADKGDKLGWRIVSRLLMAPEDFESVLKNSADSGKGIEHLLPDAMRKDVVATVNSAKKLMGKDQESVALDSLNGVLNKLGHDARSESIAWIQDQLEENNISGGIRSLRDIPITLTTIPTAKGLAADYVFITHFDDVYYSKDGKGTVADEQVCNLLVALTRARKKAYLISTQGQRPNILSWISENRISTIR